MNKKLTIKRIIIFCVIAFVPFWIIVPILNSVYGGMLYTVEEAAAAIYALGALGMFIPAIANVLTRLITQEGFGDSYLALNIKGNVRYYVAAVIVKPIEAFLEMFLFCKVFLPEFSFRELFLGGNISPMIAAVFLQLAMSIILFFPAFGEEWGWRGYLGPKLRELLGMPASVIAGGIIWGLWHAPLTIAGHNFGIDYPFYPWAGIGLMCVMCIMMNAFLTLLTERTKSIYPASFYHMINNNLQAEMLIMAFVNEAGQKALEANPDYTNMFAFLLCVPFIAVTGIVSFFLLVRTKFTRTPDLPS